MSFGDPNLCSKISKTYHWLMDNCLHIVCSRGHFAIKTVVGFLRKNTFENRVTRWSIIFTSNIFSCWLVMLSFSYIELTRVCCRNPDNVHCFGTIFPNLKSVLHQSAPPVRSPCNPMNREVAQVSNGAVGTTQLSPMESNQKQRCGSGFAKWHIYTIGVRGRMNAKWRWF